MNRSDASRLPILLGSMACLTAIPALASWPGPQWIFHALLVVGFAPQFRSPVVTMLWASAGGWALEASLRCYPHLGGTALADLAVCLVVRWAIQHWPPQGRWAFIARLAVFTILLFVATHLMVRLAAGPVSWGMGLWWALATVPAWGALVHRNLRVPRG